MKRVFVLATILTLAAGLSVMAASVVGSKHDLGTGHSASQTAGLAATNTSQVCGFCHVPHNAYTGTAAGGGTNRLIPLWSHTQTSTGSFTLYTSPTGTLNATLSQPAGVSRACLSCHDGTVAMGSLVTTLAGVTPDNNTAGDTLAAVTSPANLGTDLSNDHPVSFTYNTALATADGGLKDPSTTPAVSALLFAGQMECGSCHDVHDPANVPFLRMSNANSALCVTCHTK